MNIRISDIEYEEKVDLDKAMVHDLSESIAEKGLLHPIAVQTLNGKFKLITGLKRLEAAKLLKWEEIDCILHEGELSSEDMMEVHIHENLKRGNLPWYEQVELTKQLHELRQRQKGKGRADAGPVKTGWGMRDTARELGVSLGTISQDIDLAHAVLHDPSLKNIQDKRTAMRLIKQAAQRIEAEASSGLTLVETDENVVYCGDSGEVLKHLPDNFIDAVITDPPWLEFREERFIKDSQTYPVFKELYRVMKWDSFLYLFVGTEDFYFYKNELPKLGFQVQKYPLIWAKTGVLSYGVKPWEHMRDFELIVLAVKGDPVSVSSVQTSAIYNYPVVPPIRLTHPNEKPHALIKQIMLECTFDGAFILDPFGGSGVSGEVAIALGRRYILIEQEERFIRSNTIPSKERRTMSNYVPGMGPQDAKLMIVGEAPGAEEDRIGRPFVGPSGEMFTSFCEEAGIERDKIWVTNVVKYRPPQNDLSRLKEIGVDLYDQIKLLWKEIVEIKPNCILALGNTALSACAGVNGITNYRGSILPSVNGLPKVVGTYHPAALLHQKDSELPDYRMSVVIHMDFKRALQQSLFKDYRPPQRNLGVVKTSHALYQFEQRKRSDKLSVDIETTKCVPLCIGLAFSKYDAVSIPILDLQSPSNPSGITQRELSTIWQMIARMLQRYPIIGQNFKFDETKLNHYGFYIRHLHSDTMLKGHTANPEFPQSLEFLTSIYTEEAYYKNERKDFDIRKDDIRKFLIYNARDAAVTYEVDEALEKDLIEDGTQDFFYNVVMKLHRPYINIEKEGLLVDENYRHILDLCYQEQANVLELHLSNITGEDANFNSPDQIKDILFNKIRFPRRKDTSADTLVALMANVAKQPYKIRTIEDMLKYRKVKKTISTYINAKLDYDGRMRTQYRITGTETGRTSTSILEAPIRPKKMGVAFQTMTKHGQIGTELRRMFIPDPGYVFLEVDAAQAEDRPVALMANDTEAFEFWKQGRDRHKFTASIIFELPENLINKEHRFIGKKIRHAGNYDMGKHRCMQVINTEAQKFNMDIKVSEYKAGQFLERFHKAAPKIRGVFHKAIQQALQDNGCVLVTPFGRRRQFFGRWGDDLFKEAYAFIPQSTVSDHVKLAMVRTLCRLDGLRVVLESHDSFTSLVKPNDLHYVATVIKEEMERPIDFSKCTIQRESIIIPCEFQVGEKNWKDLVNYNL